VGNKLLVSFFIPCWNRDNIILTTVIFCSRQAVMI
jgi:hypothetical protein